MTIQEQNDILIVKFMGGKAIKGTNLTGRQLYEFPKDFPIDLFSESFGKKVTGYFKFRTSWDWLMPVVIKLANLRFPDAKPEDEDYNDTICLRTFGGLTETRKLMVRFNHFPLFESDELIAATYDALVDVLEWYNQTTSKP